MTIHHLINDYDLSNGGAQKVVRSLHLGLLNRGYKSKLIGICSTYEDNLKNQVPLGHSSPYSVGAFISVFRYVFSEVRPGDLIHAHLFPTNFYCSLAKRLIKTPFSLYATEHSTSNHRRHKRWGKVLDYFLYSPYHKIAAISSGTKEKLIEWLPNIHDKVTVISNGTPLQYKTPPQRVKSRSGNPIILSAGTLRDAKNYPIALAAIAKLKHLEFEYHVAGDGPLKEELQAIARKLGVADKVTWLGWVDNVWPLLERADIFLMPSRWEGFGLAAVEAMNAGLPVILSSVPGLQELLLSYPKAGVLVPCNSSDAIAKAIEKLLDNPTLRHQMGESAFYASMSYGVDAMTDQYLEWYECK